MFFSRHRNLLFPVILAMLTTSLVAGNVGGSQDPAASLSSFQNYQFQPPEQPAPAPAQAPVVRAVSRSERYKSRVKGQIARVLENYNTGLPKVKAEMLPQWIFDEGRKYGYDPLFLTGLIITESTFNNWAKSPAGALGLMQIRPKTGRHLAKELGIPWKGPDTLFDPQVNLALGSYYLKKLLHRFGDLSLALEAYNHGPTRLSKYLKKGRQPRNYSSRVFDYYSEIRFQKPGPRLIFASFPQEGEEISYWMPDMEFEEIGSPAIEEKDVAPPAASREHKADPAGEAASQPASPAKEGETYGPVKPGETLLGIVEKLGFAKRDAARAAVALWLDNRDQFARQNLNGLRVGATLNLKHLARKTERLSGVVASRVLKSQWAEWKGDIPPGQPIVITHLAETELKKPVFIPTHQDSPAPSTPSEPPLPALQTVKSGDTLLGIAENLGYSGPDARRAAVALWMENRGKFIDGNLHGLRAGAHLNLVNLEQRRNELDPKSAHRIIQGQWQEWLARES